MFINKKAQIFGIDLIIGIIIALTAIILMYKYTLDISTFQSGELDRIISDGQSISESLISEGYPNDWELNVGNVERIGIVNGTYRLDETKLMEFFNLANTEYYKTKSLFGIISEYYVFFVDQDENLLSINGIEGIGKSGVDNTNLKEVEDTDKIVKVDRFLIYNSDIIKMVIYVWK